MSYILDALRRADAERSRGAVPGLHSQSVPADAEPAARGSGPMVRAAIGGGVLVVAVVVAMLVAPWRGSAPVTTPATAPATAPAPAPAPAPDTRVAATATAPAPAPEPASPPAPRDAAPPTRGDLSPPQPGAFDPAARPAEPPIGRAAYPAPAPATYPPPQSAAPTQQATPRDLPADRGAGARVAPPQPVRRDAEPLAVEHYGAPLPAPQPATAGAAVPNINDLAQSVRAQLPRLTVGGSIYSDTPSARMLILNGQVFHEGDKPAADTVLEQIHPKSAVFNFRGQRYLVTF